MAKVLVHHVIDQGELAGGTVAQVTTIQDVPPLDAVKVKDGMLWVAGPDEVFGFPVARVLSVHILLP